MLGGSAVVSIVTVLPFDAPLALPAASVAVAVMVCVVWLSTEVVMLHLPLPSATTLPTWVAPSNSFTVLLASAVPVKVGVVTLVSLSVLDEPESDDGAKTGDDGDDGALRSSVTMKEAEAPLWIPATVTRAVIG